MIMIKAPDLVDVVARIKEEILYDIARGVVPSTCSSFSELHDYVDANCYGGFCDDEFSDKFGLPSDIGFSEEVYEFVNNAQMSIDQWLKEGMK